MGGAAMCLGNTTPSAEFNIFVDPHAANIVLDSGIPLTMMGLDVTHQVNVNKNIMHYMEKNNNKVILIAKKVQNQSSKYKNQLSNCRKVLSTNKYIIF